MMFFSNNTSSLYLGKNFEQKRFRQVNETPDAKPEHVKVTVQQPVAVQKYYEGNLKINEHNRICQQQLMLEKKLQVRTWDHRVNHTILGINDVDTYLFGKLMGWWPDDSPAKFYKDLAHEMIDNNICGMTTRQSLRRQQRAAPVAATAAATTANRNQRPILVPTPNRKRKKVGDAFVYMGKSLQHDRCKKKECKGKTIWVCNTCGEAFCHPTGHQDLATRTCFDEHVEEKHSDLL